MQPAVRPLRRGMSADSCLTGWAARQFDVEKPRVAIPHPGVRVVVRFGPAARDGVDIHVLGGQETVRRKFVRGVQGSLVAQCGIGTCTPLFGVSASDLAGRVAPLESLWGEQATQDLREGLAGSADATQAATLLDTAFTAHVGETGRGDRSASIVAEAAARFSRVNVRTVAEDLGLSERHLRRLFRQEVGMSPKRYAKITRFERAVHAARHERVCTWAEIAAAAGYYDQAHLIEDFRAITGTTPGAFLRELREEG